MPVRLLDAKSTQCRFIADEPTRDAMVCGRSVQAGSSYCPEHHRRCYVNAPAPRRTLRDDYVSERPYREEEPVELTKVFA